MERKEFIKKMIMNGSIAAILPTIILQSCEEDDPMPPSNGGDPTGNGTNNNIVIDLNDPQNSDLLEDGSYRFLNSNEIIVINKGNKEFIALSTTCTHKGCTVDYSTSNKNLPCPCHGSVYDIDGSVINGPANAPLRTYNINLADNTLTIEK